MLRRAVLSKLNARAGSVWQTQIDRNSDLFSENEAALKEVNLEYCSSKINLLFKY